MVTTSTTPTTPAMDASVIRALASTIAALLGETEQEPTRQIARALRVLGTERARGLVDQSLEVEASGGMMLPDGSRRRTVGGVFFHLVRSGVSKRERRAIFWMERTTPSSPATPATGATGTRSFDWGTFRADADAAMSDVGEATTVKLTVIGRPGKVVERGDVVLVALRSEKAPSLPKGVPTPTSPTTDYMALVGRKQWGKVAAALAADPADKVIVEGYPTVRADFAGITVHVTSATTTGLQAGKRASASASDRPG